MKRMGALSRMLGGRRCITALHGVYKKHSFVNTRRCVGVVLREEEGSAEKMGIPVGKGKISKRVRSCELSKGEV